MWAGLRGAVSLALVENIPLYNNVTKEGCEFKPVLKAMTSATIIFTTFVFGGSAYYVFPYLGIRPDTSSDRSSRGSLSKSSLSDPDGTYQVEVFNEIIVTETTPQRQNRRTPRPSESEMRDMSAMDIDKAVMA